MFKKNKGSNCSLKVRRYLNKSKKARQSWTSRRWFWINWDKNTTSYLHLLFIKK